MTRSLLCAVACGLCAALLMVGCNSSASKAGPAPATEASYFQSPHESVEKIAAMLRARDWKRLANYYDLTGTSIQREELTSGRFFERTTRPPNAVPAVDWRIKQPFSPGFKFDHTADTNDPSVIEVILKVEIEQGGGMTQRGLDSFRMRHSAQGYQLLPKAIDESTGLAKAAEEEIRESYTPKLGADTVLDYRPRLEEKLDALPEGGSVDALVPLLREMEEKKRELQAMRVPPRQPKFIPHAGVEDYNPLDEQLIISEIGDRIRYTLQGSDPKQIDAALQAAGWKEREVTFNRYEFGHVDVMGSGRVFYCKKPFAVRLRLQTK
jgi:hypothetical protein